MSGVKEIEQKEWLDRTRFVEVLREWVDAIEKGEAYSVLVSGNSFIVPAEAMRNGRFRVEYEIDEGEHEFELTLKWR